MTDARHIPTRTCMACRSKLPKNQARRYFLNKSGAIEYDKSGKQNGRGVYVCSQDCYDKVQFGISHRLVNTKKDMQ